MLMQQIINGATIGLVYSLMGLGFSLVWATAQTINFSQGAIFSLGGYAVYTMLITVLINVTSGLDSVSGMLSLFLVLSCIGLSILVGILVGSGVEKFYFRPLREAPELAPLLGSTGIGLVVYNLINLLWGTQNRGLPNILPQGGIHIGDAQVSYVQIIVLAVTCVVVYGIHLILQKTKIGKAMRATSWDLRAAKLMGINTNHMILIAFAIACALSSTGGMLVALYYGSISPFMGFSITVKGLAAAVLGGFGNPMGAIVGGISLGIVEALTSAYVTTDWKDFMSYSVLILVIVFFPSGLFGRKKAEAL